MTNSSPKPEVLHLFAQRPTTVINLVSVQIATCYMDGVVQNFKVKTAGFYPHTSGSHKFVVLPTVITHNDTTQFGCQARFALPSSYTVIVLANFVDACSVLRYTERMEPEIVFVPSAFKHGVTREDIIHAYRTMIHDGLLESYGNKYGFIGFNRAGNPIEVFYNPIGDDTIKVFHAMGRRDGIIVQIEP
jgi:hypothetical protein